MLESQRLDGAEILIVSPTPTWPLDHGNRKRIHSVCSALKDRGAIIHFLYYPSEGDWRNHFPKKALHVMQEQWDYVYKVTPSVPLHTAAKGDNHLIDEWWDEAIENEIKWLTLTNRFEAVIVNYPWLSKALEFVPKETLKVLDTHDRFSNRGELLQNKGIKKEFFHTSQYEETKALVRADIVWAIKHEEEEFFTQLLETFTDDVIEEIKKDAATEKALILAKNPLAEVTDDEDFDTKYRNTAISTLLHVEDKANFSYRYPNKKNNYLTVGIVGAYNNINLVNTREFLDVALPIFEKCMVPVKIVLAGSMCQGLQDIQHPFVEQLGRVESLDDFYSQLDIALIPMTFSTGLKIKAGEALAYGLPVIAHKHAYEGYPATHEWQQLESLESIAHAVIEAATDNSCIEPLKKATDLAQKTLHTEVLKIMDVFSLSLKEHFKTALIVLPEIHVGNYSMYVLRIKELLKNLDEEYRSIFFYPYTTNNEIQTYFEELSNFGIVTCKHSFSESNLIWDDTNIEELFNIWNINLLWNLSDIKINKEAFDSKFHYMQDFSFKSASDHNDVDTSCDVLIQSTLPNRLKNTPYTNWHHNFTTGRMEDIYKDMWKEKPPEESHAIYMLMSGTKKQLQFWYKLYTQLFHKEYKLYWIIDSDEVDEIIKNRLNLQKVSQDYSLLKDPARCTISVNLSQSNLLASIAWTLFVNKRRVYDVEEIAIDNNGTFTLYNFYKEMKNSVEELGLNDYSNRFQHCSSHKIKFDQICKHFNQNKVSKWLQLKK